MPTEALKPHTLVAWITYLEKVSCEERFHHMYVFIYNYNTGSSPRFSRHFSVSNRPNKKQSKASGVSLFPCRSHNGRRLRSKGRVVKTAVERWLIAKHELTDPLDLANSSYFNLIYVFKLLNRLYFLFISSYLFIFVLIICFIINTR